MWRKIHSNRDPRDTLYSELRREFRPQVGKLVAMCRKLLSGHPRLTFSVMLALLLVSAGLSFTVFRQSDDPLPKPGVKEPAVVSDGFGQIMQEAGRIREAVSLKRTVDSLTAKKQLVAADSALLDSVLDRLQQIQQLK